MTVNSENSDIMTGEIVESLSPKKSTEVLAQKSQDMLDSVKHFIDLQKQINKRLGNLNQINKQVADALHRWCPHEVQNHRIADSIQVCLSFVS